MAFLTVPAHTEAAHTLMYWHLAAALTTLALSTALAVVCWRRAEPAAPTTLAAELTAALLSFTGYLGGVIVYHTGAGVDPAIRSPEIGGHSH